jgi:hypothetical protein
MCTSHKSWVRQRDATRCWLQVLTCSTTSHGTEPDKRVRGEQFVREQNEQDDTEVVVTFVLGSANSEVVRVRGRGGHDV